MSELATAKGEIEQQLRTLVLSEAKMIFDTHPELESFGWHQFNSRCGDKHVKKYTVYHTINTPNINGASGSKMRHDTSLSKDIVTSLKKFDPEYLFIGFGDDADVCIYKDLTFEVNPIA